MDSILPRWNQSDFIFRLFQIEESLFLVEEKSAFNVAERVLLKE